MIWKIVMKVLNFYFPFYQLSMILFDSSGEQADLWTRLFRKLHYAYFLIVSMHLRYFLIFDQFQKVIQFFIKKPISIEPIILILHNIQLLQVNYSYFIIKFPSISKQVKYILSQSINQFQVLKSSIHYYFHINCN